MKWSAYAQHGAGTVDLRTSRRILLHARGQTTTCPPHTACVAVHLDPASSSPAALGTVLLHSAHIIHVCLATKPYPTTNPLDVPRRFDHPAGYWAFRFTNSTADKSSSACSIFNEAYLPPKFTIAWTPIRISSSRMMAMGNGKTTARVGPSITPRRYRV